MLQTSVLLLLSCFVLCLCCGAWSARRTLRLLLSSGCKAYVLYLLGGVAQRQAPVLRLTRGFELGCWPSTSPLVQRTWVCAANAVGPPILPLAVPIVAQHCMCNGCQNATRCTKTSRNERAESSQNNTCARVCLRLRTIMSPWSRFGACVVADPAMSPLDMS